MKKFVVKSRTLWHNGLLLILVMLVQVAGSKVLVGLADEGVVNLQPSGHHFMVADELDRIEAVCQKQDHHQPDQEKGGVLKWVLNGNQISSKTLTSGKDAIQLDKAILTESVNKLECFVQNEDLFRTSSYAFTYFVKEEAPVPGASISLDLNEGDLSIKEGGRVSLRCKVEVSDLESFSPLPEFSWLKNAKLLDLAKSQNFDVKVISGLEQHLVLDNVSASDAGNYGCLVAGSLNLYEETSLNVKFVATFVEASLDEVLVNATENVVLECQISSANPPVQQIIWLKDETLLSCDDNDDCAMTTTAATSTTLTLSNVGPAQSGSYSCQAQNEGGTSSRTRTVKVLNEPPKVGKISLAGSSILASNESVFFVLEGSDDAVLNCEADGWPLPSVSFVRSGETFSNPVNLKSASEDSHQGAWTCIAENQFSESDRKSVQIVVPKKSSMRDSGPRVVQPHVGSVLTLSCEAEIDKKFEDSAKYFWSRNGENFENGAKSIFEKDVSDLGTETNGIYKCRVETPLDSAERQWEVKVVQGPIISETFPTRIVSLIGKPFSIPCHAAGIPEPEIKWTFTKELPPEIVSRSENEMPPKNSQTVSLSIETLSTESAGYYVCSAENEFGKSELGVVVIGARQTLPAPDFQNETVITARAGDSVELGCDVIVDPVVTEVASVRRFWEKDGKILDEFGDKLNIPYLVGREHSGTYSCVVDTHADRIVLVQRLKVLTAPPSIERFTGNSKSANSGKKVPEFYILRGDNLTVSCDVTRGIPFPQISWKRTTDKGDEILTLETSSSLSFFEVEQKDEGEYNCLAVNEYGSDQKTFRLIVLEPTTIPTRQDETHAETFADVRFQCSPDFDKRIAVRISWIGNDGQAIAAENLIKTGSDSELVLRSVTKKSEGHYVCFAETDYDVSNTTFRLSVSGESPTFISTEKDVRALEGSNVTVSCQANGLPLPKISWFRDGSPLKDRRFSIGPLGDLTMTLLTMNDAGEYSCRAENIYGIADTVSNVEVLRRADAGNRESGNAVVKNVGENVTLVCDVSFDPRLRSETRVRWFFKEDERGSTLRPVFEPSKFTSKKMKPKFETKDNLLKITDLKVENKGVYECLVETPFEKINYSVNLFVNGEAPKILSELKKKTIYEGETLELSCLVRGSPRPSLRWFFNDRPLTANLSEEVEVASPAEFRESKVRIATVTKRDDGVYQCETSNLYGSGIAKFAKVTVIGRTSVRIGSGGSDPEKEIVVHAGEKLKIPCRVDNDPANRITNITWEKDGHPITVSSEDRIDFGMDGSVTIANVQKRHGGLYRCTATTVLDSANDTVPMRVIVNAPVITSKSAAKQVVFDGDSLALLCNANGIPEPRISWVFNKTRTNVGGSEYRINKAILSDTGEYICEAKNPYGETRHTMEVEVILLPHLPAELFVDKGSSADLSCVSDIRPDIDISWQKDFKDILFDDNLTVHPNGTLSIRTVTDNSTGSYTCTVATKYSSGSRKRILQIAVRLRPVIITSLSGVVNVVEGSDAALACLVVPGLEAKRLWRFNGDFFAHDARRDLKKRGERLEIRGSKLSDSGNYSCVAIAPDGERDTVHFDLRVIPRPITLVTTPSSLSQNLTVSADCSSQPLTIASIYRLDNSTVLVTWTDGGLDRSCYSSVALVWWTNVSEASTGTSEYSEKLVSLTEKKVPIAISTSSENNLEVYYVQANLVGPLNVQVYGETRSFIAAELSSQPEISSVDDGETDPLLLLKSGYPSTTIIVISLVVVVIVVAALLTLGLILYRRKYLKNPEPLETMCGWRRELCSCLGSSRSSQNSARFGKTNFNGFDRGAFEHIIISSPMPLGSTTDEVVDDDEDDYDGYDNGRPNLQRHSRFSVYRGSAYLGTKGGANLAQSNADFVTNMAPQWPEPEEPVSVSLANIHMPAPLPEREPFLAPKRHHRYSPGRAGGAPGQKRGSKESISSSWSSLFNVPAVSTTPSPAREVSPPFASTSVAIRPNSTSQSPVMASNDPPPAVTSFINNKPRNV